MSYYAYLHARPNTENALGIFYVGKGKDGRAYELNRPNPHHRNIVRKYGAENILVGTIECSSEQIAFDLEVGLIKCLKRMDVRLSNKTSGGDGVRGFAQSEQWRKNHSETMKGRTPWNKGAKLSEEHRLKVIASQPRFTGKSHTVESRAKMGVSKGMVWVNDGEHRFRVSVERAEELVAQGYRLGMKINR